MFGPSIIVRLLTLRLAGCHGVMVSSSASSGYLFGVVDGTLVVLLSATIAAAISFTIGRTLLRSTVEE